MILIVNGWFVFFFNVLIYLSVFFLVNCLFINFKLVIVNCFFVKVLVLFSNIYLILLVCFNVFWFFKSKLFLAVMEVFLVIIKGIVKFNVWG